jgi:MSHA biogenesis protein MshN
MSVINQALSQAAEKQSGSKPKLEAAAIPAVKRSSRLAWAAGAVTLSLCLAGWVLSGEVFSSAERTDAVLTGQSGGEEVQEGSNRPVQVNATPAPRQQPVAKPVDTVSEEPAGTAIVSEAPVDAPAVSVVKTDGEPGRVLKTQADAPVADGKLQAVADTRKTVTAHKPAIVREPETQQASTAPVTEAVEPAVANRQTTTAPAKMTSARTAPRQPEPLELASNSLSADKNRPAPELLPVAKPAALLGEAQQVSTQLRVEQVELSPEQVAERAVERARRALDSNDLTSAIKEFETALKYRPVDNQSRKRLAALYYGRQDVRNAVEVLRKGIRIQEDNQALRIALSRILVRQQQPEAALSPLRYLPSQPGVDYLALRAALAQQVKQTEIALESYQLLVEREGDNARWWLGLGIQHERLLQYNQAEQAYSQALARVGVSQQTQAFIRDRLALIARLQGEQSAD